MLFDNPSRARAQLPVLERIVAAICPLHESAPRIVVLGTTRDDLHRPEAATSWREHDAGLDADSLGAALRTPGPLLVQIDPENPDAARIVGLGAQIDGVQGNAELAAARLTLSGRVSVLVVRQLDDQDAGPWCHVTVWEQGRGFLRVQDAEHGPRYLPMQAVHGPTLRARLAIGGSFALADVMSSPRPPVRADAARIALIQEIAAELQPAAVRRAEAAHDGAWSETIVLTLVGVRPRAPRVSVAITGDERVIVRADDVVPTQREHGTTVPRGGPGLREWATMPSLDDLARLAAHGLAAVPASGEASASTVFVVSRWRAPWARGLFPTYREPDAFAPRTIAAALTGGGITVVELLSGRVVAEGVEIDRDRGHAEHTAAGVTARHPKLAAIVCRRITVPGAADRLAVTAWRRGRGALLVAREDGDRFESIDAINPVVRRILEVEPSWFELCDVPTHPSDWAAPEQRPALVLALAALLGAATIERRNILGPHGTTVAATVLKGIGVRGQAWPPADPAQPRCRWSLVVTDAGALIAIPDGGQL